MKRLALLVPFLILMGQECEPAPTQSYCEGMDGVVNSAINGIDGFWNSIIGGFPAEERNSTVFVSILGTGSCSGTILSDHTVLTAGHCNGPNGYRVYLDPIMDPYPGCATSADGTIQSCWDANASLPHPGYYRWSSQRGEPHDDLMLLFFDNGELPGPYPQEFYGSESSEICERTFGQGWGQTARTDAPPPEDFETIPCENGAARCLQEATIKTLREKPTDVDTQLVSTFNWGNICFGDSGGPYYAKLAGQPGLHLAGVTSTISSSNCVGTSTTRAYSTHVKLWPYRSWIIQNMH